VKGGGQGPGPQGGQWYGVRGTGGHRPMAAGSQVPRAGLTPYRAVSESSACSAVRRARRSAIGDGAGCLGRGCGRGWSAAPQAWRIGRIRRIGPIGRAKRHGFSHPVHPVHPSRKCRFVGLLIRAIRGPIRFRMGRSWVRALQARRQGWVGGLPRASRRFALGYRMSARWAEEGHSACSSPCPRFLPSASWLPP
jgi:hypothetical protein